MKKLRILIVDDVEADIKTTTDMLKKKGHSVLAAKNGDEGIKMAKEAQPDLILMDVVMPEMNGYQATRSLKNSQDTANIPVIMVSQKDQESDRVWAMKQGANAYLTKQFSQSSLISTIETVMA